MDAAQKIRIMKRYLNEKSTPPTHVDLGDNALAPYAGLDNLLDYIEQQHNNLFDFSTLEQDVKQWREFANIITHAASFIAGSPPALTATDNAKADFGIHYWHNAHDILALPQDNYYARPTITPEAVDADFNAKILNARAKLHALTQTFPNACVFDPANSGQVQGQIDRLQNQMKTLPDNGQKIVLHNQLTILLDLNKINLLARMDITKDDGSVVHYCTLAESAGGVTEKISLVSLANVKQQLGQLDVRAANGFTVETYIAEIDQYKLSTQAILKLPKHGKIKEVQREAMALNISRMMGLNTANSTAVSYRGRPALFVPFDDIKLFSEFAQGKSIMAGTGFQGQTYTHYSTINPVGEGNQADCFVDDLGNFFSLLFLSSDTDAIGGYNQNKALRDSKSLYVFDLVIMGDHRFKLDSRLSLQPDQFIMKHTRHGQGRNRTLVEDSSMVEKYESLKRLKQKSGEIAQYADHIIGQHQHKATLISQTLTGPLTREQRKAFESELSDVEALKKDAGDLKKAMLARVAQIDAVLPKTTGQVSSDDIRQSLILEKLLHNPLLFRDDGRPHKHPWTERQKNNVETITDLGNGDVQINFGKKIPADMFQFVKRQTGANSMTLHSAKAIRMSKAELATISEVALHPEANPVMTAANYLTPGDLLLLKGAYSDGHRTKILDCISLYRTAMDNNASNDVKISAMTKAELDIKKLINSAKDKGFGKHLLKKLYFDAQQKLQAMMPQPVSPLMNQAFNAALKLDRVSDFNAVVKEAISQNKLNDAQFTAFLNACVNKATAATNHSTATAQSQLLSQDAQHMINLLQVVINPALGQLNGYDSEGARFEGFDPVQQLGEDLSIELQVLNKEPHIAEVTGHVVGNDELVQDGIRTSNT